MAAMVGLAAFAAQASYSYTWQMTINNIPSSFTKLSDNAQWYLVDTTRAGGETVLFYNTSKEYASMEWSKDNTIKMETSANHDGSSVMLGGKTYKNDSHVVESTSSYIKNKVDGDTKKVTFVVAGETETNLYGLYGNGSYDYSNLVAYLYDPDNELNIVYSPVGYSGKDENTIVFTASSSLVPEPTSGLLVLFGLAGLALKRKRAA